MDLLDKQRLFSGRGLTDWFSVASPAAGANASFTVGGRNVEGLRVLAALATVATDSNAANRLVSLDFIDARSVTRVRNAATLILTADTAATVYQWDQAHAVSEWNTGTPVFAPVADTILTPGWRVQITLDNKQATDAITAVSFVVEAFYAD